MMESWQVYPRGSYTPQPSSDVHPTNISGPQQTAAEQEAMAVDVAVENMVHGSRTPARSSDEPPADTHPITNAAIQDAIQSGTVQPGATLLGPENGGESTAAA